jgi:hypothetical protein
MGVYSSFQFEYYIITIQKHTKFGNSQQQDRAYIIQWSKKLAMCIYTYWALILIKIF